VLLGLERHYDDVKLAVLSLVGRGPSCFSSIHLVPFNQSQIALTAGIICVANRRTCSVGEFASRFDVVWDEVIVKRRRLPALLYFTACCTTATCSICTSRLWYTSMTSVCLSVRLSVTLVDCDHTVHRKIQIDWSVSWLPVGLCGSWLSINQSIKSFNFSRAYNVTDYSIKSAIKTV